MKRCTKCGIEKSLDCFYFQKNKYNGNLSSWCNICISQERKDYREKNKEAVRKKKREYGLKNRAEITRRARERRDHLRKTDPVKLSFCNRARWLKKEYGLTQDQYDALRKSQNDSCAVCSKKFVTELGKGRTNFGVDHCHKTGEVRGLLCLPCNSSLGLMKENIETLLKMVQYLKFHKGE